MSNTRRIRRNLAVISGRFAADVREQGPGGYSGTVEHDDDCPGLKYQSMLHCTCKPKIVIKKLCEFQRAWPDHRGRNRSN